MKVALDEKHDNRNLRNRLQREEEPDKLHFHRRNERYSRRFRHLRRHTYPTEAGSVLLCKKLQMLGRVKRRKTQERNRERKNQLQFAKRGTRVRV